MLAGLRGEVSIEVCREHEIAETLYYSWREKLLEGGQAALAGRDERGGERDTDGDGLFDAKGGTGAR